MNPMTRPIQAPYRTGADHAGSASGAAAFGSPGARSVSHGQIASPGVRPDACRLRLITAGFWLGTLLAGGI